MREYTVALLKSIEDGILTSESVIQMCLSYLSEDDVRDMCHLNNIPDELLGITSSIIEDSDSITIV